MEKPKFNWPIWVGVVLSIFAFLSHPLLFVNWPVTRDFPWANIALFVVAAFLLFVGIRRAFAPNRRRLSKIFSALGALLSVLVLGMFILVAFIGRVGCRLQRARRRSVRKRQASPSTIRTVNLFR